MGKTVLPGHQVKDNSIAEADIGLADVTTLDVSTSMHGFVPKAPNDTTKFLRGDGTWNKGIIPFFFYLTNRVVSPNDGATYYWGSIAGAIPTTTEGLQKIYLPAAGTIKKAYISWLATGVAGTNENISVYIRLNGTTDTLIATVGDTNAYKEFIKTNASITIAAGDYIEIKVVCPTWATNPTVVGMGGTIYMEVNTI